MKKRFWIFAGCFLFSTQAPAFNCFLTLVKDSCWTDYAVTVTVTDVQTSKPVLTVTVPKGKSWNRQPFICQSNELLMYQATFEPEIWEGTGGRIYKAMHYWTLPAAPSKNQTGWSIPICFPKAFAEVPLPPTAGNNCGCDMSQVPPVPPGVGSP